MLFMVIERFKDRDPIPVYKRVRDQGIKFPEGLTSGAGSSRTSTAASS
jgi:ribosomal protein S12 methylthiotransferase accessory factor YcaO